MAEMPFDQGSPTPKSNRLRPNTEVPNGFLEKLRRFLPSHIITKYGDGSVDFLLWGAAVHIYGLIKGDAFAGKINLDHELPFKSGYELLKEVTPAEYHVQESERPSGGMHLDGMSARYIPCRNMMVAACSYITALKRRETATSIMKTVGSGSGDTINPSQHIGMQRQACQDDFHDQLVDFAIESGTTIDGSLVVGSTLTVDTITKLKSNNRTLIIVAQGTADDRVRNLCAILIQMRSLSLPDVEAQYVHCCQWIAISFRSRLDRETDYQKLSSTIFLRDGKAIERMLIRRFYLRAGESVNDTERGPQANYGVPEQSHGPDPGAPEETKDMHPNNQLVSGLMKKTSATTEIAKEQKAKKEEKRERESAQSTMRQRERKRLGDMIPKDFSTRAKAKATIKSLHAAKQYIASLTKSRSSGHEQLPDNKAEAADALREKIPPRYINKTDEMTDTISLFIGAQSYITHLTQQPRNGYAAETNATENGKRSTGSPVSRPADAFAQHYGTNRTPATPLPTSVSRKRPVVVDLTSGSPSKVQKRTEGSFSLNKNRMRSIEDGAVAIPIPRKPTPPPSIPSAPWPPMYSGHETQNPYFVPKRNLVVASIPQPQANTHAARSTLTTGCAAASAAKPAAIGATATDDLAAAALAGLDRLDDVVRERRAENVLQRELNKFHSTQGANSIVKAARKAIKSQQEQIAKLEGENRRLKRWVRILEEAAAEFE